MKYFKLLRVSHWIKNLIIFVPALLDETFFQKIDVAIAGFICFSLIASAGYIFNDLLDLESDKKHPTKKMRPIPSGKVKISLAIVILVILLLSGLLISLIIDTKLVWYLIGYILIHVLYTKFLKKIAFFDLLILVSFYLLRLFFGAHLTDTFLTGWLVVFVFFSTLSLSIEKRYAELELLDDNLKHRGYSRSDILVLLVLKYSAVFISLIVLNIHAYLILKVQEAGFYAALNLLGMGVIFAFFKEKSDDDLIKKLTSSVPLFLMALGLFLIYILII
jgi:4-hydroxybenzoate polyprenyltransferase